MAYTTQGATQQYICTDQNYNITPGTWNHVALTISADRGVANLYLNGRKIKKCPVASVGLTSGAAAMRLGHTYNKQAVDTGPYVGAMDAVRFYDRPISATEVEELYTQEI